MTDSCGISSGLNQTKMMHIIKRILPLFLLVIIFMAGCYSSKYAMYQPAFTTDDTWKVKVEKSGFFTKIKVTVNDSIIITKAFPVFDWVGIDTNGTYRGHSVELMVTFNNGFLGIGSYYSATVTVDKKYFVGQFKLPTVNLSGD